MKSRHRSWFFSILFVLGILTAIAVGTKQTAAQPTCTGAGSASFLYLPWNSDDWGDWLGSMNTAFDHDFPDYSGTSKFYSPGQEMKIDLWNGEEARPKILSDGYGYCLQSGTWVRCMNPGKSQISTPPIGKVWGYRAVTDEFSRVYYDGHDGYDWGLKRLGNIGDVDAPIYAAASGVVSKIVYWDPVTKKPPLGNYIEIDHLNGYKTRYGHLKKGSILVSQGQCVEPQTQLAVQGSTGNSTGEHLHFSVLHNGKVTDPFGWCYECIGHPVDPLKAYNGEESENLWYGVYPRSFGKTPARLDLSLAWDAVDMKEVGGADQLEDPTPSPTQTPGPTPTQTPPPPVTGWDVKVYSAPDECSSADCNPSTTYYQRTESGSGINASFSDGKPWGVGSVTTWGSKWTQTINFPTGSYVFHVDHNDGARVFVNGQNIIDVWGASENNQACPARDLSGNTQVVVLWKNTGGDAHLNFWWDTNTAACNQSGTAWSVRFYSDPNECTEANCNPSTTFLNTNVGGPNLGLYFSDGKPWGAGANDVWGSIWHGTFNFPDGNYVFYADHDDGLKIFLGSQSIMDVWGSSENNTVCPARHLSGNTDVTLIWRNTGGPAHLYLTASNDTSPCNPNPTPTPPPGAPTAWVERSGDGQTHIALASASLTSQVRYFTLGSTEQVTVPAWYVSGAVVKFDVPQTWDAVEVDGAAAPIIGAGDAPEWFNWPGSTWVSRKRLSVWIDSAERTRLSYWNEPISETPPLQYWVGPSSTITSSLWYSISGGSEAILPENVTGLCVNSWIYPRLDEYAATYWKSDGNTCISKRTLAVDFRPDGTTQVWFYQGIPGETIDLGRSGQPIETITPTWQTANGVDYYTTVPSDVVSFKVNTGPIPLIQPWSGWVWGLYTPSSHWVVRKNVWVYKDSGQHTLVRYQNDVDASVVPVHLFYENDPVEHITTTLWYQVAGGLEFQVPDNAISFLVMNAPVTTLTDPALAEWSHSPEAHWNIRKFVRVRMEGQNTYVTYLNETVKPDLEYWRGGQLTISKSLWTTTADGKSIEALLPEGVTSFKVDAWIVPQVLPSAAGRWTLDPSFWIVSRFKYTVFLPYVTR